MRVLFMGFAATFTAATVMLGGCPKADAEPRIAVSEPARAPPNEPPPALVVVVVIDQMGVELVERLGPTWTHGLRRAFDEGLVFTHAEHAHARTYTAPGHASLVTGLYPNRHGVITNDWLDVDTRRFVSPIEDPAVVPVGADAGRRGAPRFLMAETVGDWLHARHPVSQVIALAPKDRAAILMGGKTADLAMWFEPKANDWITSTYYRDQPTLPGWVSDFRDHFRAPADGRSRADQPWTLRDAPETYTHSRPDAAPYEQFGGELPHTADQFGRPGNFVKWTFHSDEGVADFALAAVAARQMGVDEAPDLLLVGFSASDYVGHSFGPHSREIEDHYRRLDVTLGRLWDGLDASVGAGRWRAVLTSDHGVVPPPEYSAEHGFPDARRVNFDAIAAALDMTRFEACPTGSAVFVDRAFRLRFPASTPLPTRDRCTAAVAASLTRRVEIEEAFTAAQLEGRAPRPDSPFFETFRRGHFAGRSPEITVRLRPRDLRAERSTGTRHGSAHPYDRRIPLVWLGFGAGVVERPAFAVDVAPTLARVLGLDPPADLDGAVLPEVVER